MTEPADVDQDATGPSPSDGGIGVGEASSTPSTTIRAGMFTLDDAWDRLRSRNTPEGRELLKSRAQGSREWVLDRLFGVTGARASNFAGHGYKNPSNPNIDGYNTLSEAAGSLASLMSHPYAFNGNKSTVWGNAHEKEAIDTATLRLRMQLRARGLPHNVRVDHCGTQTVDGHPWVGYSTDGDGVWLDDDGSVISHFLFEAKCPTYKYPSIPSYYFDQMQMMMGFSGTLETIFVVWMPHLSINVRVFFDPEYFTDVLLPRMKEAYLYVYLPALLHCLNYGTFPSWVPMPEDPNEREGRDPEVAWAAQLDGTRRLATRTFIPEQHVPLPNKDEWSWSEDVLQSHGLDRRASLLQQEHWTRTWKGDRLFHGGYSSVPFVFPFEYGAPIEADGFGGPMQAAASATMDLGFRHVGNTSSSARGAPEAVVTIDVRTGAPAQKRNRVGGGGSGNFYGQPKMDIDLFRQFI